MKKNTLLRQLIVTMLVLIAMALAQAGTFPKFSIIPTIKAPARLPRDGIATAQYLVINNTAVARILTMVPIAGVIQNGGCSNPFILAPGQSCLLTLQLVARQMFGGVHSGPEVCNTIGPQDNRPDPFLCSQASLTDTLEVTLTA